MLSEEEFDYAMDQIATRLDYIWTPIPPMPPAPEVKP